jgi:nucleoside-triphosphatase THEP1
MEVNKLAIIFESYKQKKFLLNNAILPYKNFMDGFFSVEIREKNKLEGYNIEFLDGRILEFASKNFVSELYYNKYAIKKETLIEIAKATNSYIKAKNKIILLEVGSIFITDAEFSSNFIKLLSSDKKIIIFSPRQKEIVSTIRKLDDLILLELNRKTIQGIKKITDEWLGENVSRINLYE